MLKMLRKRAKNQKGFTLVEVIVVAVIVAVLAAIAIPLYLGYINSSRQNVVDNAAGSLASFCGASLAAGTVVTAGTKAGSENFTGAQGTTWIVPNGLSATVAATTVTVMDSTDNSRTKTVTFATAAPTPAP